MNADDEDGGGVVIRRDFGGLAQIRERTDRLPCRHLATVVDEEQRTLACASCNAQLDPFQVLLEYARKERHWRHWQAETRKAQKHLEELKEEERKVKARTQSASRKEANVAVEAERARTERQRLDTIEIAREVAVFARRIEALQTRGPRKDPRTPEEGSNHGRS